MKILAVIVLAPVLVAVWWFGMQAAAYLAPAAAAAYGIAWVIDTVRGSGPRSRLRRRTAPPGGSG